MFTLIAILVIAVLFVTGSVVSLYASAVYIAPDEVASLFPKVSRSRREFLEKLVDDPRAFTQVATIFKSLILIISSILMEPILQSIAATLSISSAIVLPVGFTLFWGCYILAVEVFPRRVSRKAVNVRMVRYMWLFSAVYQFLRPIVDIYRKSLHRRNAQGKITEEEKEEIIERAIETLAEEAGISESIVEDEEKEMIGQIFLLDQTVVKEIMIPRQDVVGIEKSMSFTQIRELVRRDGHSRYPIFEDSIDKIIGLLYVKDLFNRMPEPGEEFAITRYLRKPYLVPETKIIGELLREFKEKRLHIAIVVDEYGGVAGLVTLEDIIEEIFGEIQDEHDLEEEDIVELSNGALRVNAALMVEQLQSKVDTDYETDDGVTVGGLIYDLVGSVPRQGQKIDWHDYRFEVDEVDGQRIQYVTVWPPQN